MFNAIYFTKQSLLVMSKQTCSNFDLDQVYKLQVFPHEITASPVTHPAQSRPSPGTNPARFGRTWK